MKEEFGPVHTFSDLDIDERKNVQLNVLCCLLYDIEYYYISYGIYWYINALYFYCKNAQNIPVRSVQNKVSRDLGT
jgi:hypothetical protein